MPSKLSTKTRKSAKKRSAKQPPVRPHRMEPRKLSLKKSAKLPKTANVDMDMTDLQFMAKEKGIPFGGLSKPRLVRKINNYSF